MVGYTGKQCTPMVSIEAMFSEDSNHVNGRLRAFPDARYELASRREQLTEQVEGGCDQGNSTCSYL